MVDYTSLDESKEEFELYMLTTGPHLEWLLSSIVVSSKSDNIESLVVILGLSMSFKSYFEEKFIL